MAETFICDGNPHDSLEELIEEYGEPEAYEKYINDECGAELEVRGKSGLGHVGVVAADFWCDNCGKHYTAAKSRTKWRNQNS